jgi:hypothetical protein
MSGAQGTPSGTAVEHAREFGADEILLGSYSARFPAHSTPTGLQPEFDHLIAWVLVGRSPCQPDPTAPAGARPYRTSWTIVDARTGEIDGLESLSDADCQPIGGR